MRSRYHQLLLSFWIICILLSSVPARAESHMMIILDASSSMSSPGKTSGGSTKFKEVSSALTSFLKELPADVAVGLRIIGGTPSADCYSSYLYFTPSPGLRGKIQDQIAALQPSGTRALVEGIDKGMLDLLSIKGDKALVVITDGGDACGRDFNSIITTYALFKDLPRLVIFGLDLTPDDNKKLGELSASLKGRLIHVQSTIDLERALTGFARELKNNLRIHLQNEAGTDVKGDITIIDVKTGQVVGEYLDLSDYSTSLLPGTYQVKARYLGKEISSEQFTIEQGTSKSISLVFDQLVNVFELNLNDIYGNALKARVIFLNSQNEPVFTTGLDAYHRVEIPADTYTLEVHVGDRVDKVFGVVVGPGLPNVRTIEIPVELAVLEAEISNMDGTPLNGLIRIMSKDGTVVDEAPNSSYLYSKLPPGEYQVMAKVGNVESTKSIYLYSGEQEQLPIELDFPVGDLFIMLRTASGNDVWGSIRIFDSNGLEVKRFSPEWPVESPDWALSDLPIGFYRIEATTGNITRTVSGVEIKDGKETEVVITFPDELG